MAREKGKRDSALLAAEEKTLRRGREALVSKEDENGRRLYHQMGAGDERWVGREESEVMRVKPSFRGQLNGD